MNAQQKPDSYHPLPANQTSIGGPLVPAEGPIFGAYTAALSPSPCGRLPKVNAEK